MLHEQVIVFMHGSGGGILHRQNAVIGPALPHSLHHVGEGGDEEGAAVRVLGEGEKNAGRLVGIGTGAAGAGHPGGGVGHRTAGGLPDGGAQGFAGGQLPMLEGAGGVHHGGEHHRRRPGETGAPLVIPGSSAAHPVQHLLFPLLIEHGQMMRRLIGGHLQGTIHPAAEQGDQLVVQTVDFGTDIGEFHGRIIPFQSVGAMSRDGLGL